MDSDIFRHIKEASELIREVANHVDSLEVAKPAEKVAAEQTTILSINMDELRGLANGR